MTLPRGVALNNPLNLRQQMIAWVGLATDQPDAEFCKFKSPEYGFRAPFIDFRTKQRKHGINTIRGLISRWAPPEDNNDTEAYIRHVCAQTGHEDSDVIDFTEWDQVMPIVIAMTVQEQGSFDQYFTVGQLRDGALLAGVRGVPEIPDHDA